MRGEAVLLSIALGWVAVPAHAQDAPLHDALFECLDSATEEFEAFQTCNTEFQNACWAAGEDIIDYPPQTACLNGAVQAVLAVQDRLDAEVAANPDDTSAMLTAATLRYALSEPDAFCGFLDETKGGYDDEKDRQSRGNHVASCLVTGYSSAYWWYVALEKPFGAKIVMEIPFGAEN